MTVELAWSDRGYPAHGRYRDYHHHTSTTTGRGPTTARPTATTRRWRWRASTPRTSWRARSSGSTPPGGLGRPALLVCALDTELLGHWWYEGAEWLRAVRGRGRRAGAGAAPLDDALARDEPAGRRPTCRATTWGTPRDPVDVVGPAVADLAWAARDAELRVVGAGDAGRRASVRELLGPVQRLGLHGRRSLAAPYGRERAAEHTAAAVDGARTRLPRRPRPQRRSLRLALHAARAVSLRVLILSWEYPPIVEGGLARHVRKLSEQLVAAEGVEVHVLTRGDESMAADQEIDGVLVHRVREPRRPRDLRSSWPGSST